jgi:hypothetical protein
MNEKPTVSRAVAAFALAALLMAGPVRAGEHNYPITSEAYRSECGACHVAYPPQLLPAPAWKRMMGSLSEHFGADASLGPETAGVIDDYLQRNAARRAPAGAEGQSLRITEARWFRHEHGEELPASVWRHPAVKSAANCEACHTRAGQGDYGERSLRVPR